MNPINRKFLSDEYHAPSSVFSRANFLPLTKTTETSSPPTDTKQLTISGFHTSLTITILILLIVLFFVGFFFVRLRRLARQNSQQISLQLFRVSRPPQRSTGKPHGVDPATIQSLPLTTHNGNGNDCAVCLSEFEVEEIVKMIPSCRHVFHPECIDKWLRRHGSCPLCRSTKLLKEVGESTVVVVREDTPLESSSNSVRRVSSLPNLGETVSLRRSLSF